MSTFFVSDSNGNTKEVSIKEGWSLMEILREEGYDDILAMCGGCCSCATCHVLVEPSQALPPIDEDEEMLVMTADGYHAEKSRLSCQIPMTGALAGLRVSLVSED